MIKKYFSHVLLACFLTLSTTPIWSQKDYTMTDAVLGLNTNLAVENINGLQFRPDNDAYIYLNNEKTIYYYVNAATGVEKPLLNLDQVKGISQKSNVNITKMPNIQWLNKDHLYWAARSGDNKSILYILCQIDKDLNVVPVQNNRLPVTAENIEWNEALKALVYTQDNNLFVSTKENVIHTIASDANKDIIYGQSVHRNEFGIHKGIFISPKGQLTAFYRMDQTMVADYPIIDWLQETAVNNHIKYPMAGGTSHHVTLGIYNHQTQEVQYIKTGEPADQYLTCVTWDPSEKYIYIAILNRAQNHMKLNQYDVKSGELVKTLFEETHPKYVEPQHSLYFLPNGQEFVWMSQRDGFMHAYLYDTKGQMKKQLTQGVWVVKEILGFDPKGQYMYFTSNKSHPQGTTISRVQIKSGKVEDYNTSLGAGVRTVLFANTGKYILDNFRNPSHPRQITLINTQAHQNKTLLVGTNTLESYNNAIVRNVTLKTENNIELYGKLILPHDFDSTKKYPVIVYLYNGPHLQLVTQSFPESGNLWYDYMTQRGFIVWTMDGRGSANRGLEFENAVHNQLGKKEAEDQMVGVNYLKSLPFVDGTRMGINGWSFGGFMTTYIMTHYPDVFKAGVAGGPVIDWNMYEIMYTERYMSSPQTNPQGYKDNNLLNHVKNLKGKLLMIHGADDDVVVWQHSMKFINACIKNNIPIDYFVYPGHKHNVVGKDRVHLMQKIADYFIQNL